MASTVLTDAHVTAGSDISVYVQNIVLNYEAAAIVETRMGQTTEVNKGGVFKWNGSIGFKQDYADNLVDEIVFALIGTTGTFAGRPSSAAQGAGNPSYNGTALFTGYAPLSAAHGELVKSTLAFVSAGALSRSV
jgi:hypothetical protein